METEAASEVSCILLMKIMEHFKENTSKNSGLYHKLLERHDAIICSKIWWKWINIIVMAFSLGNIRFPYFRI
jgi:hypothetical protein